MSNRVAADVQSLQDVERWYDDTVQALEVLRRRIHSRNLGGVEPSRWFDMTDDEVDEQIKVDLNEAENAAIFGLLASCEAQLINFLKESPTGTLPFSIDQIRSIERAIECLEQWLGPLPAELSSLKGWSGWRNWYAHGRHWTENLPSSIPTIWLMSAVVRNALASVPRTKLPP